MLSPEQFAELLELIQITREEEIKSEVRRAPRVDHPCRFTITVSQQRGESSGILVQMKDISARGMCFTHGEALATGTEFIAQLESPGKSVSVKGQVVHCRELAAGTFQIGAEFAPAAEPVPLNIELTAEDWMQTRPRAIATATATAGAPSKRTF